MLPNLSKSLAPSPLAFNAFISPACIILMVMKPLIRSGGRGHGLQRTQINNAIVLHTHIFTAVIFLWFNSMIQCAVAASNVTFNYAAFSKTYHHSDYEGHDMSTHSHKHMVCTNTIQVSSGDSQMESVTFMAAAEAPVYLGSSRSAVQFMRPEVIP